MDRPSATIYPFLYRPLPFSPPTKHKDITIVFIKTEEMSSTSEIFSSPKNVSPTNPQKHDRIQGNSKEVHSNLECWVGEAAES